MRVMGRKRCKEEKNGSKRVNKKDLRIEKGKKERHLTYGISQLSVRGPYLIVTGLRGDG